MTEGEIRSLLDGIDDNEEVDLIVSDNADIQ